MCKKLVCLVVFAWVFGPAAAEAARVEWVRAAYWDARYWTNWADDSISVYIRDGLEAAGYEILDADQLKTWMDARIADGKYSVVVFCRDIVPDTVAETMDADCTLRRYLDAGGKVVFYADIPLYNQGHVAQTRTTWGDYGAPAVLGFNTSGAPRNTNQIVKLTAAGTAWGLTRTWPSVRPALPTVTPNLTILATDNAGNAGAWVKHYVAGDTFRGFVRIWDFDVTPANFPTVEEIMRVAEYSGPRASNPRPANGAAGVGLQVVQWDAAKDVTAHQVYFGTDRAAVNAADTSSPEYKGQQSVMQTAYIYPLGLVPGTAYYWRIDEVLAGGTVSAGDVWSFTAAPQAAWAPKPANGARYVAPDAALEWMPGLMIAGHDVYFGTDRAAVEAGAAETKKANMQPMTSYTPAGLEAGMTYHWRVDEVVGATVTTGEVWSFTVQPVIAKVDPAMIGWWKLEDEDSGTAVDYSGWDHHGRLVGNPQWVQGYAGDAMKFDGIDDYVDLGNPSDWPVGASPRSMCAWAKAAALGGGWRWIAAYGSAGTGLAMFIGQNGTDLYGGGYGDDVSKTGFWNLDVWHHICLTYDGTTARLYADGVEVASVPKAWNLTLGRAHIGRQVNDATEFWSGMVDDVRLYNVALTPEQILEVMQGDLLVASDRQPARDATLDIRNATELSWLPGATAAKHDVYFGKDREAVEAADASAPEYKGRQAGASYSLAGLVESGGGSYFWRVDEVEADGTTIHKGDVWQFTVPDYLLVDEFEGYRNDSPNRMFQTWRDGYGYSADEFFPTAYLGNGTGSGVGHDIWTAGTTFTNIAERIFVHGGAQSMPLYYHNDSADMKYYSEAERIWTPPADLTAGGVTDLSLWFKGRPARFLVNPDGSYTVNSTSGDISGTNNDYFRFVYKRLDGDGSMIVKVNGLNATHQWAKAGVMIRETLDVTSTRAHMITTPIGRVAFENRATTGGASASVYSAVGAFPLPIWLKLERKGNQFTGYYSKDGTTWIAITNAGGGGGTSPNPQTITMTGSVYIGLCVTSNNTVTTVTAQLSDVTSTGGVTGDWTVVDIGTAAQLNPANDADDLYVAVQDKSGKVAVATWANGTVQTDWTQWKIPLSQFTGVNMSAVAKIFIGVGNRDNPQPDGAGLVYIDEIRVIKP